jgi:hypothetical protein
MSRTGRANSSSGRRRSRRGGTDRVNSRTSLARPSAVGRQSPRVALNLKTELESLIDALMAEGVEFAICGGIAVTIHGAPRFTKDIDLLVKSEAVQPTLTVARRLGFTLPAVPMVFHAGTEREQVVHRVSKPDPPALLPLDLIVAGVALKDVWTSRILVEWEGRRVPVVSLSGLVTMKRLAGRDQDRLDIKNLGIDPDEETP